MNIRVDLGGIVPLLTPVQRSGGTRLHSHTLDIAELSIDLSANSPEAVLREAGNSDKNEIARDVSGYVSVERYCALYLVGPVCGFPVKIGITDDPRSRLSSLQTGNHEKIIAHAIFWTTLGGAFAIEQKVIKTAKAADMHERGEWLTATPSTAVDMVMEAAAQERVSLFTSAMAIENRGRMMRALDKAIKDREAEDLAA